MLRSLHRLAAIRGRKGREDVRERKSVEFNGKNVEEAISRGLSELNLERDDVEVRHHYPW